MGAGSGICGAAAIIATAPVVRAESHNVIVAVATIVIYGTVGIFLYPYMYAAQWWPVADAPFGIYIGSSVHEVAQVVAAGKAINDTVANLAVTTKMIRVMMLASGTSWRSSSNAAAASSARPSWSSARATAM